jgi:hypothetical protein
MVQNGGRMGEEWDQKYNSMNIIYRLSIRVMNPLMEDKGV